MEREEEVLLIVVLADGLDESAFTIEHDGKPLACRACSESRSVWQR